MLIKNPTKEKISVVISLNNYTIEPEGTLKNVPEADARYWQENLHKFLVIRKDELETSVDEVIEIPKAKEVEEVKEEEIVPEKEEKTIEEEPIVKESPKSKKVK